MDPFFKARGLKKQNKQTKRKTKNHVGIFIHLLSSAKLQQKLSSCKICSLLHNTYLNDGKDRTGLSQVNIIILLWCRLPIRQSPRGNKQVLWYTDRLNRKGHLGQVGMINKMYCRCELNQWVATDMMCWYVFIKQARVQHFSKCHLASCVIKSCVLSVYNSCLTSKALNM